ncbi:hypothetical protein D3C81_2234120 [compost metagenome]
MHMKTQLLLRKQALELGNEVIDIAVVHAAVGIYDVHNVNRAFVNFLESFGQLVLHNMG